MRRSLETILAGLDKWLARISLVGIIVLAFLMSFHTVSTVDFFWHLKTGELIWQNRQVPHQDLFSFTVAGKEWIDSQWLFQLIIYPLYRFSGYTGMILFGSVLTALSWFLILQLAFNPARYFSSLLLCLISLLALSIRLRLRPELLSFFYLSLELFLIHQYRRGKKWVLYFLPVLLLFWLNSEGLWPIYFVVLGAFLLEEMVFAWAPRFLGALKRISPYPAGRSVKWVLILVLCSLPVILLNPYGVRGALFPAQLFTEVTSSESFIRQSILDLRNPFSHYFPWFVRVPYIVLIAFSSLIIISILVQRRIPLMAFLLWLAFLYISVSASRNLALFAIVSSALLGELLAEGWDKKVLWLQRFQKWLNQLRPLGALILILVMIWLGRELITSRFFVRNLTFARFGVGALETDYPIRAGETLKAVWEASGKSTPLKIFSHMNTSGYLIWIGYPDWKVYVDPRLEVYGEEWIKRYFQVSERWEDFLTEDQKYDFDAVVMMVGSSVNPLIVNLYHHPGWSLVHLDGFSIVFVKNKPALLPGIERYRLDLRSGYASSVPAGLSGPWLARERLNRATTVLSLGFPELAWQELQKGLEVAPEDFSLNALAGLELNLLQRYPEAIRFLEKAARLDPKNVPNLNELAWAYFATGKVDSAIQIYQKILKKYPKEITTCMNLALVYEQSQPELALSQWRVCHQIYQSAPEKYQQFYPEIKKALLRMEKTN